MDEMPDEFKDKLIIWYNTSLDYCDIIAGGSLLLMDIIFVPTFLAVIVMLYRDAQVSRDCRAVS